jgi:hypothetical protein
METLGEVAAAAAAPRATVGAVAAAGIPVEATGATKVLWTSTGGPGRGSAPQLILTLLGGSYAETHAVIELDFVSSRTCSYQHYQPYDGRA